MRTRIISLAAACSVAVLLAACSGPSPESPEAPESDSTGSTEASGLPEAIAASGELRIGNSAVYPPMSFLPEGEDNADNRIGFDVDLARAIAEHLGVEAVFEQQPYEQYLPSLATGRLDVVQSAMQDLESRRETVDFVDYMVTGPQLFAMADTTLSSLDDLCGGTVVLDVGDVGYRDALNEASADVCADDPIEIVPASGTADALIQLEQGRADATIRGAEAVRYIAEELEPGVYALVGDPLSEIPVGIAIDKGNDQLRDAIAAAVQALIDDGTYAAIAAEWGLSDLQVERVTVNGAEVD